MDNESKDLSCKRGNPRFKTSFPAKIEGELFCIPSLVTNVSACGLQFECDLQSLQVLMPNVHRNNQHIPIKLHVHFEVPTPKKPNENIDLICSIIYIRRATTNSAQVGCQFNAFEGRSEHALFNYIEHFAAPT